MAYDTINTRNVSEGMNVLFEYTADTVPIFFPMLLFAFFCIVALSTFYTKLRLTGDGGLIIAVTVASWMTAILSFFMLLVPLVSVEVVVICLTVSILSTILLFVTKD